MEFMEQHMPRMRDIPDVGHFLLAALAEAHQIVLASGVKDPEGEAYVHPFCMPGFCSHCMHCF